MVEPGDTVVYNTREVSDGQIGPDSTVDALHGLDRDSIYPLAGPVAMADAEPGDLLAVEVLDMHKEGWGWIDVASTRSKAGASRRPSSRSRDR